MDHPTIVWMGKVSVLGTQYQAKVYTVVDDELRLEIRKYKSQRWTQPNHRESIAILKECLTYLKSRPKDGEPTE